VLRRRGFVGVVLARTRGVRRLECLEKLPLGPQQVLHLIRMGDTELLLACSPSGCTLVKSFTHPGTEAGQ
jgi:flagellar biogenesis protein FliO